jgi:hypothetical protein
MMTRAPSSSVMSRCRARAAGALLTWLCAAAVLLAGCGSAGQAGPRASGPDGAPVTSGAWRTDVSGTLQPLDPVACLSALRCEAVDAAGTILATWDGGYAVGDGSTIVARR